MCRLCRTETLAYLCTPCASNVKAYTKIVGTVLPKWTLADLTRVTDLERSWASRDRRGKWVPDIYTQTRQVLWEAELEGRRSAVRPPLSNVVTCRQCGKDYLRHNKGMTCDLCRKRDNTFRSLILNYYRTGNITDGLQVHMKVYNDRHLRGLHVPGAYYELLDQRMHNGHKVPEWFNGYYKTTKTLL